MDQWLGSMDHFTYKGNPLISGQPRLVKYYNLARIITLPETAAAAENSFFGRRSFQFGDRPIFGDYFRCSR